MHERERTMIYCDCLIKFEKVEHLPLTSKIQRIFIYQDLHVGFGFGFDILIGI